MYSNDAIPTPRQKYNLKYSKSKIIDCARYISEELPTYKFLNHNEHLNSIRIEITRAFQPQHLDIRFENEEENDTSFEIEISKHTGGMTNDDSNLFAKQNLDEFMTFLIKCLEGYRITEEDKKSAKKGQNKNMILYLVVTIIIVWWIGSGIWW